MNGPRASGRRRTAPAGAMARLLPTATFLLAIGVLGGCGRDQSDGRPAGRTDGDGSAPAASVGLRDAGELGPPHLLAFGCGQDDAYLAVFDSTDANVILYTPHDVRVLTQRISASGARFGDERYSFWTKGHDEILLEVDGLRHEGCEPSGRQRLLAAAYQAGFAFRANGNEPFWNLHAGPQLVRLERLGEPATSFDGVAIAELADGATIERVSGPHTLRITIARQPCRDSMSGEPSPWTVLVELDGEALHGCGVRLR